MNPEPEGCGTKKKGVNLHYEEQWERYSKENVIERVKNLTPVLDAIINELTVESGSRILDLGCGPVILPLRVCELLGEVDGILLCGIDISGQALHLGKEVVDSRDLGNNICLLKGDCEELPFQNDGFDAVISNATVNLLLDKKKGFGEVARVTKKGGTVIIGDCTTRNSKQCCEENDDSLWSACISGAPTKPGFEKLAREVGLEIFAIKEMTGDVTRLVKKELWNWPEFVQYEMDYHVFAMRKK